MESTPESDGSLLERLDLQQDAVIAELDELNLKIEGVLATLASAKQADHREAA